MATVPETDDIIWVELVAEDVLVGEIDPVRSSRLGRRPDEAGLQADLSIAPDATGRILVRVPEAIAPENLDELYNLAEVWEPRFDASGLMVGARGMLYYDTQRAPSGEVFLEVIAADTPLSFLN